MTMVADSFDDVVLLRRWLRHRDVLPRFDVFVGRYRRGPFRCSKCRAEFSTIEHWQAATVLLAEFKLIEGGRLWQRRRCVCGLVWSLPTREGGPMPQAGTRKVVIDGQEQYLPKADAELVELLRAGCQVKRELAELQMKESALKSRLVDIATARRINGTATIHLEAPTGQSARVQWSQRYIVDPARADELRHRLAADWAKVFSEKTTVSLTRQAHSYISNPDVPADIVQDVRSSYEVKAVAPKVELIDVGD